MFFDSRPLIVKCGTEFLYAAELAREAVWPYAVQNAFDRVAAQVAFVEKSGVPVVIISSGAIKEGQQRLSYRTVPVRFTSKEYAGIGTPHLYKRWSDTFGKHCKSVAQILVTAANLSCDGERQSIARAIAAYHINGVIPIVNENDVVADAEQRIGDNDRLARIIAELVQADAVLFLTLSGGVYEEDPVYNSGARQYKEIDARMALTDWRLTNGIAIKLLEAVQCFAMGMRVAIAGAEEEAILKFAAGEPVGTMISDSIRFY